MADVDVQQHLARDRLSERRGSFETGEEEEGADIAHLIVTFLALLELAREELVSIAQTEPYAPIHVTLTAAPAFELAADES